MLAYVSRPLAAILEHLVGLISRMIGGLTAIYG